MGYGKNMNKISIYRNILSVFVLGMWWATMASATAADGKAVAAVIQDNVQVTLDYTLTVDGKIVDASSKERPFQYVQGKQQIIPGLEAAVAGLKIREAKHVTVAPEQAYGQVDPRAFVEIPKSQLPKDAEPKVGMVLHGKRPDGVAFAGRVREVRDDKIVLDLNHPLAGKTLEFDITVTGIDPAPAAQ